MSQAASNMSSHRKGGVEGAWSRESDDVLESLEVDASRGLSRKEARQRASRYGKNRLREKKRESAWKILLHQFKSLVVGLLGAATVVSFAFGQWVEGVAIAAVVLVNAGIGFATELRAVRSMEALRRLGRTSAKVRRDGEVREIAAGDLVPGDIVLLDAGDVVTADLRLIDTSKLQANESTLTGESVPVGKDAAPVGEGAPLAERRSMLFKGTSVTRGSGLGVVVATGMATELGHIASLAEEAEQGATPLERQIERLGRRLVGITLVIAAVTSVAGILRGKDPFVMVETGIALAVAAIPEGLPIVATLALARGMWRMARRNALINRLSAVETLGATNVILTDKTGTLTENQMTVVRLVLAEEEVEIGGRGLELEGAFTKGGEAIDPRERRDVAAALEVGVLCNNASLEEAEGEGRAVGDPMEVALLVAGAKGGVGRKELVQKSPEKREEAFDPQTRAMATFHERDGAFRVAVKGAPEAVIEASRQQLMGAEAVELGDDDRQRWLRRSTELANEGLRVLALAEKSANSVEERPYEDLTLIGLAAMRDPPREEVRQSLALCSEAGVRVVMVTGDQPGTALSIARSLGLVAEDDGEAVEGKDLPGGDSIRSEDRRRLIEVAVFARVDPEQKLRLIQAHQEEGSVVAMTGDGVNDAPALRKADIGVAMGKRGTQVAREAADMVLRDDSFDSIVLAIRQGRIIFGNIRRFVLYLLSCNISEILIVFGASTLGVPLPVLPLQILYLNLVTDVFPALALGFGEGDETVMKRPPRDSREPILTRRHWLAIGVYGLVIGACVLGALGVALSPLGFTEERAVTVSFLTLAFAQVWHVFNMRERGSRVFSNDVVRNVWVWGAIGLCTLLLVAATYLPGLSTVLGTVAPGAAGWVLALAASLVPLVVGQAWIQFSSRVRRNRGVSAR